jgi:YidC/Oxa1 family membrane protein insertase
MALSMFISQRSMPTSMDPAQQRMMMVMPIVFMTMFFAAPAGLNLYWFASNLCTILQQLVTLRIIGGREGALTTKEKRAR